MEFGLCSYLVFWGEVGHPAVKVLCGEVEGTHLVGVRIFETYYRLLTLFTDYSAWGRIGCIVWVAGAFDLKWAVHDYWAFVSFDYHAHFSGFSVSIVSHCVGEAF